MLRTTCGRIFSLLSLDNKSELKVITYQNKCIQIIKEMDGASSSEIKKASEDNSNWHTLRQKNNESLPLSELTKKQKDLLKSSKHFNAGFYLTLGCSLTNTLCIIGFFVSQTDWSFWTKILATTVGTLALHESEVHLYKAKRFFVQKYEITKLELESINAAIQKKMYP